MDIYEQFRNSLESEVYHLNSNYYHKGDSLYLKVTNGPLPTCNIVIQNREVPEIDVKCGRVTRYFSTKSPQEANQYLKELKKDIETTIAKGGPLKARRATVFGFPVGGWGYNIKGLKHLGVSPLQKILPTEVET